MCGVIGLLIKDRDLEAHLGKMLVSMIAALAERGPDSSGIAVYSGGPEDDLSALRALPTLRISLGSDDAVEWDDVAKWASANFGQSATQVLDSGARIDLPETMADALVASIDAAWPAVRVLGTGRMMSVVKEDRKSTRLNSSHH